MRRSQIAAAVVSAAVATLSGTRSVQALPAFPGAKGFGADATGGRGGEVYRVTSLADTSTPGTLRYGLREQNFPAAGRTIVFDVGGTINLTSNLDIKNVNGLRIAGQTAPGNGITLTGYTLQITSSSNKTTSNIVVQHIRSRMGGFTSAEDAVGVLGSGSTHTVVLDHLSASWTTDEVLSLTNNSTNVTVQNSFINEGLNAGGHGYASLIRPRINASYSYHHNLVAHHKSRMPRPGSYNGMTTNLDFVNNVLYNWLDGPGYSEDHSPGEFVNMNYVGNYGIAGPSTPANRVNRLFSGGGLNTQIYQEGNLLDSNKDPVRDGTDNGWAMFVNTYTQMPSAFATPPITTQTAEDAYETVLLRGGALPWARDASDERVVNEVRTQSGAIKNVTPPDEWNAILTAPTYTRPAGWDTDNDGMPTWWELSRGSNPNFADGSAVTPSGYTRLENYLNYITNTSAWGESAAGNWSEHANWRGGAPNSVDALATFVSLDPGPVTARTITVDQPQVVGMINFDSPHVEFTINGPAPIVLADSEGIAAINLLAGARHTIAAPLQFLSDGAIVVMPADSTLSLAGTVAAPGAFIAKQGPGTAEIGRIHAGGLVIGDGRVRMLSQSAGGSTQASVVGALSIAGGPANPTAQLDLADAKLVVDYEGSSPLAQIQGLLINGYAAGSWDGNGIASSSAADNAGFAVGYAEAADVLGPGGGTWNGVVVDNTSVLVAYARYGDANLDGIVNLADFNRLASNFGSAGTTWSGGDFNFDGVVNLADFNLLAANFGLSASGPDVTPEDWAALASVVPEPGSVMLGGTIAAAALLARKRR